jgi:hypothetical protein
LLEVLTLVCYPGDTINDRENDKHGSRFWPDPKFVKPDRRSRHGKRATHITKLAAESLETAKKEIPSWTPPKIEVIVRRTGTSDDWDLDDVWEDDDDGADLGSDEEEDDEEAGYYAQLPDRMSHQAWKSEVKRLKHKYLPSRKMPERPFWMPDGWEDHLRSKWPESLGTEKPLKERYGEVLTDSEAESGGLESAVVWSEDEDKSW